MRKLHLHGALQEQGKRTNRRIRILRMSREEDIYEQTAGNGIKLHFCMRNTMVEDGKITSYGAHHFYHS